MNLINQLFLEALHASLHGECVQWETELTVDQWSSLFRLAHIHQVLPLLYEAVYACPAAKKADGQMFAFFKRATLQAVMLQTMKTRDFLALLEHIQAAGVTPCVVKGIVCRGLYPKPDLRSSGDEDVLIPPHQYALCHEAMTAFGMEPCDPQKDRTSAYEVPYSKKGSPIYIELHKSLFPPESDAYGDFNRFFADAIPRRVKVQAYNAQVPTMNPTDHFFYLICHAFKHFLHSGVGIRQVCDMVLFANRYGKEIDWEQVMMGCSEIHATDFTAALMEIGRKYLGFDPDAAGYPASWRAIQVDEEPMLDDLLGAGVYGDADMNRKHSSNITLNAVSDHKAGKRRRGSLMSTAFPTVGQMERRYPYLNKYPFLLPAAWIGRFWHYLRESRVIRGNSAAETLRIGEERIELMRKYRIIR